MNKKILIPFLLNENRDKTDFAKLQAGHGKNHLKMEFYSNGILYFYLLQTKIVDGLW